MNGTLPLAVVVAVALLCDTGGYPALAAGGRTSRDRSVNLAANVRFVQRSVKLNSVPTGSRNQEAGGSREGTDGFSPPEALEIPLAAMASPLLDGWGPVPSPRFGAGDAVAAADGEHSLWIQIPTAATIRLVGSRLGDIPGRIVLEIAELSLPARLLDWRPDAVTAELPATGLSRPTKATISVFRADGTLVSRIPCQLLPSRLAERN